ncbi:hypothetical protein BCR44DRAFT_1398540 [Catenaria anguillulae PL171]|uniref:DNA sliding clamp PCNA n=1 Tax=Catenaria anguillulae PL171 TaxID=765915 RepID=A0A1Y2GCM9_9FUNG|nr:hypothetical protein BCR44DRAFT_1398540 [Catenaria anguillulae PL171]
MVYIVLSNATANTSLNKFKSVVETVKELSDEVTFSFDQNQISFLAMDMSHVSLTQLCWASPLCDIYQVQSETQMTVSLKLLSKVFKCSQKGDLMSLTYSPGESRCIVAFGPTVDNMTSVFHLPLMDPLDIEQLQVPDDLEFSHSCSYNAKEFETCVKNISSFSESCTIKMCSKDCFLKCDQAQFKMTNPAEYQFDSTLEHTYAVKYLTVFCKAAQVSERCIVHQDENMPLCLVYPIGECSSLSFHLAPKLDDNE